MSQDLVRIRDNQRRSRARRKEYIEDIETRLRQCERYGTEVSHEIQVAARKVVEENKRLRELLRNNGLKSEDIDTYLQSSINDVSWKEDSKTSTYTAVQALEQKLSTRINCGDRALIRNQPGSTAFHNEGPKTTLRQMASSVASNCSNCRTGGDKENLPSNESLQSLPLLPSQDKVRDENEDIYPNLNNCTVAADVIIAMAGGDSNSVKADLGCQPGIDCEVDNQLILSVMDRYTGNSFSI